MRSKYDEEEELKEISHINEILEKKLKIENSINEGKNEIEEIKENADWEVLEDQTYHFIQSKEKLFDFIKKVMKNSQLFPITIKENSQFWNLGDSFTGQLFDIYEFRAKVIKLKKFCEPKTIAWIFSMDTGDNLILKLSFYTVSTDNSTILRMKIKYSSSNGDSIRRKAKIKEAFNSFDFLKTFEKMMKKEPIFLTQYESGIISGSIQEVWDILTDNSKLTLVAPNNDCFVPINVNKTKTGEIVLLGMKINEIRGYFELKLDAKEKNCESNEWMFSYSTTGGAPFKIIRQTVVVKMTKINRNETRLSIFTKIYDKISLEKLQNLSQKKKYVISSLKDYFENFFTPNKSDNI